MSLPIELIRQKYKVLAEEVEKFVKENADVIEKTGVYRGTQILYSQLIYKPKFLLIGINPGDGYYRNNGGKNVEEFKELKELEYIKHEYALAEETKKLFEMAGLEKFLRESSVKTNWVFLATNGDSQLKILLRELLNSPSKIDLHKQSFEWVKRIIEMVEPEIIICEGKWAFENITNEYVLNCKGELNNGFWYAKTKDNIHVIGYNRFRSRIKDKKLVAAKIRELVS